jgi:hypothetical protein
LSYKNVISSASAVKYEDVYSGSPILEVFRVCNFAVTGLTGYGHKTLCIDNKLALKGIRDKC